MATQTQLISYIDTQVAAIAGINATPTAAPDETTDYPFYVVKPVSGQAVLSETNPINFHTIRIEIHVSRLDFPKGYQDDFDIEDLIGVFRGSTTKALLDGNGTIQTDNLQWFFSEALSFAGVETIGYMMDVPVKQMQT